MSKKLLMMAGFTALVAMPQHAHAADDSDDFSISSEEPERQKVVVYDSWYELGLGYSWDKSKQRDKFTNNGRALNGIANFSVINRPDVDGQNDKNAYWMESTGSNLGQDNRRLSIEGGKQGSYRGYAILDQQTYQHFEAKTPFDNVGGNALTLPSNWAYGGTPAGFTALQSNLKKVDIEQNRNRFILGATLETVPDWQFYTNVRHEEKVGTKTYGFLFGTGDAVLVPSPINYQDDQVSVGGSYSKGKLNATMEYKLHYFSNQYNSLKVTDPYNGTATGRTGEMALDPSNISNQVHLSAGYSINDKTRLTGNFSYMLHQSDETLLPYTSAYAVTQQALPRNEFKASMENIMANIELAMQPMERTHLKFKYNFRNRDTQAPRNMYNYVRTDETIAGATQARINSPFDFRENKVNVDVRHRTLNNINLTGGYELATIERNYAAAGLNIENTFKAGASKSLAPGLKGSAGYTFAKRVNQGYDYAASARATNNLSAANKQLPNFPGSRMFHEADRNRHQINANLNYIPQFMPEMDFNLRFDYIFDDFDVPYAGVHARNAFINTLDVNYTPQKDLTFFGFGTVETRTTDITNGQNTPWRLDITDHAITVGGGSEYKINDFLKVSGEYSVSHTDQNFEHINLGQLPDVVTDTQKLSLNTTYDHTDKLSFKLGYQFDWMRSEDWAWQDLTANTSVLGLGETSPEYNTHTVKLSMRYRF